MKIDKRADDVNDDVCYGYMRLTHTLAVCCGLPITRRRTDGVGEHYDGDSDEVRATNGITISLRLDISLQKTVQRRRRLENKVTIVKTINNLLSPRFFEPTGHKYAFDWRVVHVWLAYATLDAFIIYYNYLEASGYVGASFRKCFEESYCFAVIELANRNLGPFSTLACAMFYGRRHKAAALAGTERVLAFIRETDRDAAALLSPAAKYYSAAMIVAYSALIWMYTAAVPVTVIFLYSANALSQIAVYSLATFQYYVLGHGYARIGQLLESDAAGRDARRSLAARVARLARVSDEFGRQAGHLNRAYSAALLLKWPYTVVRITMVVFRIIELWAAAQSSLPFARVAAVLVVEHVGEIFLFLVQLSYFCYAGARLSSQANRTAASLQKFKLQHRSHMDLDLKKTINIFWIQLNARKINSTIGGFFIVNMDLMKAICGVIATYFLVLIQFKSQKGKSKPLYHIWN
ncbi:uncharacterized protein LOC112599910 [Melanaphis sacchari]|uniref:uncharacterized protein LOC112599506 n=1 Tax=Melanaphis sacchari TaxID=742174 RepID=UPI000DC143CF|nr:uncharacterized protein LOC112599506 [Melanaphis sacchari]XP_025202814.1 uncharacterized protein LOC112599910 [Melanaphis sacchari]